MGMTEWRGMDKARWGVWLWDQSHCSASDFMCGCRAARDGAKTEARLLCCLGLDIRLEFLARQSPRRG